MKQPPPPFRATPGMKLYPTGHNPTRSARVVCRPGWATPAIVLLVCWAIVAFWGWLGIWFVAWAWGAVCLLLTPLLLGEVYVRTRPENWLLAFDSDSLWINLRDAAFRHAAVGETVVRLAYHELRGARRFEHTWERPSSDGAVKQKDRYLDLFVEEATSAEIEGALHAERKREVPWTTWLGGIRTRSGATIDSPVAVPEPGLVRVAIATRKTHARPGMKRVLAELAFHSAAIEGAARNDPSVEQMNDAAFSARIDELLEAGDRFAAAQLVVEREGVSLTDAMRRLGALSTGPGERVSTD